MEVETTEPAATQPAVVDVPEQRSEMEDVTEKKPETNLRSNAIYITGVDDLHTNDIERYMVKIFNKPFQIEWIDDSSLNIVYDEADDAFKCLVALTDPEVFEAAEPIAPETLRRLKPMPEKPEVVLQARFAYVSDKKENNSRAKSRYYLFHGEPSRKEDLVRFGTRRSAVPMKYGTKGREIATNLQKVPRGGDLFPDKAPSVPVEDDDDLMKDLLPHLAKKSRRRGRNRNRRANKNRDLPDLFADKVKSVGGNTGPKKASDDSNTNSGAPSVYQNMDY